MYTKDIFALPIKIQIPSYRIVYHATFCELCIMLRFVYGNTGKQSLFVNAFVRIKSIKYLAAKHINFVSACLVKPVWGYTCNNTHVSEMPLKD